jgi:hypothetical protein
MFILWNIGGPLLLLVSAPRCLAALLSQLKYIIEPTPPWSFCARWSDDPRHQEELKALIDNSESSTTSICQYEGIVRAASLHNKYSR